MDRNFTLPLLQVVLDGLPEGRQVTLARKQVNRLFGLDDVGATRVLRFADGHHCIVVHVNDCVVFEKRSAPECR